MPVLPRRLATLLLLACLAPGCATRPPPLPRDAYDALPWGALHASGQAGAGDQAIARSLEPALRGSERPRYALLALSGGGAKGAFGAGLLTGWTKHGTRPEFKVVTGVSTGALMATFAFLGPSYDHELERFYTTTTDADVFEPRGLLGALTGDAVMDTAPLRRTIARSIDEHVLAAVAEEHRKGRRLYVGTTDLDSLQLVVWDLGAIAASDRPDKLERYREVLRASASIPIAFPPVYFPVDVGGKRYWQMHVDGAATANVFFSGFMLDVQRALEAERVRRGADVDFYVILNTPLDPRPIVEPVNPNVFSIASQYTWSLLTAAQTSQLVRLYRVARGSGFGFHLAGIPEGYPGPIPASFDPDAMTRLFRYAEGLAAAGYPWRDEPPGLGPRERMPEPKRRRRAGRPGTKAGCARPSARRPTSRRPSCIRPRTLQGSPTRAASPPRPSSCP